MVCVMPLTHAALVICNFPLFILTKQTRIQYWMRVCFVKMNSGKLQMTSAAWVKGITQTIADQVDA